MKATTPFAALVAGLTFVVIVAAAPSTEAADPLLRFPDIHGDDLVFVHAEDVWTAPVGGGLARRLTDDEGEERQPKFSPDGSLIAFTAEIDGNRDVYVMAGDGSGVERVTFHPSADEVVGWHPTRSKILFRSSRSSYSRFDRLFLISPDGTGLEELPLHEAGRGSFSPDGSKIAYNRIAREDRTWKRYYGGMAQDLWLYDFESKKDQRLTSYEGTDRLPMWIGDELYFASDREGELNIWSYQLADASLKKITNHTDYDIRRPSNGGESIAYELAGSIWVLDTTSGKTHKVPIEISTMARETRPFRKAVSDFITKVDISPKGGRALVVARGEIFTVPAKHGPTRNLTASSDARDRNAVWSPDGESIAYFSDAGGEYQLYVGDPLGVEKPVQLTSREHGWPHTPRWSPDSSKIAFTDETLTLFIIDVASKKISTIDRAEVEPMDIGLEAKPISDHSWSQDSRWLAYSKIGLDHVSNIYLYSLETGDTHNVSDGLFNDFGPVFTRDGQHLVFVSNRRFNPTFCDFEWEMVYKDVAGLYALTLRADGEPLLPPLSDEVAPADDDDEDWKKPKNEPVAEVRVDLAGIAERIQPLPVPASNYRDLAASDDAIYFLDGDDGDFNRFEYRGLPPRTLKKFDLEDRELSTVFDRVNTFTLAADGDHLVWGRDNAVGIVDLNGSSRKKWGSMASRSESSEKASKQKTLNLDGLVMTLDPRAEWRQLFTDAWRLERDFYYDPNMNGLDWSAMRAKYSPLVDRATCAQDMRFIIGELIGELATSHTYITTGDRRRRAEDVSVGMLGADWTLDAETGRWTLARILRVPDWSRGVVPPLAGPGIDVKAGDALVAVNGTPVASERSVHAAFQGLAGEQVRLTLVRGDAAPHETVVTPVRSERTLRYLDWVEHNRRVVDEASNGRIGYIHLPDTYVGSAIEFPKYYFAQTRKQGLLIDGRFNGGGLDPDIFLQRLARKPLTYWTRRYSEDQIEPVYASIAHMALVTNRQAGSGGDMLPSEFRQKGMGPVIGTRTWGGLVGVSMFISLVDGSGLTAPDYRVYTPEGEWIVENEGVTPDIVVELDPAEMARGHDAQLHKGIEVLLEQIEADPPIAPTHPPIPTRD
jgi:tricorn protease